MGTRHWTHLDTFSGIGGFALAAAWTERIDTIGFIEIDGFCRRVLAKHWPGVPIHDDIRTFLADPERGGWHGLHERVEPGHLATDARGGSEDQPDRTSAGDRGWSGTLDLITGGFPCQPWSAAGKQRGIADDRDLWPELARVIRCTRPRYCLLENVPGIIRMAGGLDRVLADLESLGYATGTVVIPAAAVGAYHRRDRVWILAADGHGGGCERRPELDAHGASRGQQSSRGNHALGCHSRNGHETLGGMGLRVDGLPAGIPGRPAFGPDWEADAEGIPIPRVTAHEEDRVNKLKALGNAIVPQVAYELLMMLLEVDDQWTG